MQDILDLGGKKIRNRLFIGTGKFPSKPIIKQVLEASGAEVVTVALRRVDLESSDENILDYIPKSCTVVPNTSGARTTEEAVRIARLARACGCGNWLKLEVISDNKYLLPDNIATLKATEILAAEGFQVLAYMSPDVLLGKKLAQAGAAAVMPLGSPIGSHRGLKTKELVKLMLQEIPAPIIVDAGLGAPSDAAHCMELGCAAVLVNTAIATATDPVAMAQAFSLAVEAGRLAYQTGIAAPLDEAQASSPLTGFLYDQP